MPEPLIDLLRKARGGDLIARDELFARLSNLVERWRSRTPASASNAASDFGQDTLAKVLKNLDKIKGSSTGEVIRYLRMIHYNLGADAIRRHEAKRASLGQQRPMDAAHQAQIATDNRPSFDETASLETAIQTLSDDDREMLRLHYDEGFTSDEIAPNFGVTPAAVRKRIQRCRKSLRDRLSSLE
jgi:RNA polymerase sigma factor (sigma-70 family)